MDPSVKLVTPFADPENTVRATEISQMYDILFSTEVDVAYEVGKGPSFSSVSVLFRNKTDNTHLSVGVTVPPFITATESTFTVAKNTTKQFSFLVDSDYLKQYSKNTNATISEYITFKVSPLNVEGPVYVKTDLTALAFG